jgi:hypothetical protein
MFQTMDTEMNISNGPDNKSKNKYMAFLKGMGDAITGYVLAMYSNTFPGVGNFQQERYPKTNLNIQEFTKPNLD